MRILVTGGAGFIGSHIAEALLARGDEVFIVDDRSSGVNFVPSGASEFGVDIRDVGQRVRRYIVEEHGVDAVVHAAALADLRGNWGPDGEANRRRILAANIEATAALLEWMPAVPLVFLSTAAVYGSTSRRDGAREEDALPSTCESPYASSKLAGEALVAAYAHARGTPWHVLRLVNVVGARTHRGVIPDFVRMARAGRIHAADDGRQRKPWVHVRDVVEAVLRCLHGAPCRSCPSPNVCPRPKTHAPAHCVSAVPLGVYNITAVHQEVISGPVVPQLLSWWDVVDAMGVARGEVTHEERDRGAVGDPHELRVSGEKLKPWFTPCRSARDGVREALAHLGWTGARDRAHSLDPEAFT